jgi:hypothetical protein
MISILRRAIALVVIAGIAGSAICAVAVADPPPAANNQFRRYWGPMEPLGPPHAGPQQKPGTYILSYADVPRDASPPETWPWGNVRQVVLQAGRRYFVHFRRDGEIEIGDEQNLPQEEQQAAKVPDWSTIWFQNSTDNKRIAVRWLPLSVQGHDGSEEQRDPWYWGPMEPLRDAHAGPEQAPGLYRIEWAIVPRESRPSNQWPWQNGPEAQLEGGKRHFVHFAMNTQIHVNAESALPAQEMLVAPIPGRAIVWVQNSTPDKRIAVRFRPIQAGTSAGATPAGTRIFSRAYSNPNRKVRIVIDGAKVVGEYDTGVIFRPPGSENASGKPETAVGKILEEWLHKVHDQVRFEGTYDATTGKVSGGVTAQQMAGDKAASEPPHRGKFEGVLKDNVLEISFQVKLTFYKETDVHRLLKLVEGVGANAATPVKVIPATKAKGGEL